MAGLNHHTDNKETRINIRVSSYQKEVIAHAAKIKHTTVSDFVLENAYNAASQILSDEVNIAMPFDQFEAICQILDNPSKKNVDAFTRMLTKKSVLDE